MAFCGITSKTFGLQVTTYMNEIGITGNHLSVIRH